MLTKEEFRVKFDSLIEANQKTLRVMRGASDVHSLNMDKVMEGGQRVFPNYDPGLLSHIADSLRAGKQVAISAAGPDKVMVLAALGLFRS